MPKLQLSESITMFPYEIVALALYPLLLRTIEFPIQKAYRNIWVIILFSTILTCILEPDFGGLMRCIKELLYIPLLYIAFKSKWLTFNKILFIFTLACCINFAYLISIGFSFGSLNIWEAELLSSGMSNKALLIPQFSIVKLSGGSHGIWLSYSALCVCIAYIQYFRGRLHFLFFAGIFALGAFNVFMSVSREGMIVFFFLLIGICLSEFSKRGHFRIPISLICALSVIIPAVIYTVLTYGENLAIVKKIVYTSNSIVETGGEGNVNSRIGSWILYATSILERPVFALFGYGYNKAFYISLVTEYIQSSQKFTFLPESFFVETAMYGGIFCFYWGIKLWRYFFELINSFTSNFIRLPFKWLFLGLLFGNLFSGASIICDVFYAYLLITCGLLYQELYSEDESVEQYTYEDTTVY